MGDHQSKKSPVYSLPDIQLTLEKISVIENTYQFENEMMSAVSHGNTAKVAELYDNTLSSDTLKHLYQRMPQDPLRQCKNLAVINNTLLRSAAKKGGLSIAYLHTISEKFAYIIENATSIDYLTKVLPKEMGVEYANAVSMFSTLNYSDIIKETIRYLTANITKDISLTELGAHLGVNPSYLSRTFREDTGMPLINYINHQRIELSKYYFETELDNITEVAFKVGYNDSSYFAKTFKKITGITPKEYIRNLQNRNEVE